KISLDKDSIARYREFEKRMYDETSALNSAKREGIIEEKRNIAKSLLDVLDIETISKKTGLSIEEIKRL
ncbi:hypothetical protein LI017_17030, partial [Clostridium perfringens]|nr:hypothetical protein [Clostridium perfringens]